MKYMMNWNILKYFCIMGLILLGLSFAYAQTVEFSSDSYIIGDIVHAKVCSSQPDINVSCLSSSVLNISYNESCSLIAFDSNNVTCADPFLQIGSNKIPIPFNSYVLPLYRYTQYNKTYATDIATQVLVAHTLQDSNRRDSAIEELRNLRNDQFKCWPKSGCSISQTTDVLFTLHRAGSGPEDRIYQDALLWLQSIQNKVEYQDWFMTLRSSSSTTCQLKYGNNQFQTVLFGDDNIRSFNFVMRTESPLNITCSSAFEISIQDEFNVDVISGDSKFDSENEDEDVHYFIFDMKPGCLPYTLDTRHMCDTFSTSKFLQLNGITNQAFDAGFSYFEDYVFTQQQVGITADRTNMLLNIYAYNITKNEDLYTGILYNQDNIGSFKNSLTTLEALRILDYDNDWIIDATNWLESEYQYGGWKDSYSDIIMFELFHKNTTPVRFEPLLFYTQDSRIQIRFDNLTFHNYNLSLQDKNGISFTESDEEPIGVFLLEQDSDGLYEDTFLVGSRMKIPVLFSKIPQISFEIPQQYYLIQERESVRMPFNASDSLTQCSITFSQIFSNTTFSTQNNSLFVDYTILQNGEYIVDVFYMCNGTYIPIEDSFSISVTKESKPPFTISLTGHGTERRPYVVTIQNQLSSDLPISVFWEDSLPAYSLPDDFTLSPQTTASIKIIQTDDSLISQNLTSSFIAESLGYKAIIDIDLEVVEFVNRDEDIEQLVITEPTWITTAIWVSVGLLALAIISILVKYIVDQKRRPKEMEAEDVVIPKTASEAVEQSHVKHAGRAVEVFIELQRSLGRDDKRIMTELLEAGYEDEEVLRVFDDLNILEDELRKHLQDESKRLENKKNDEKKDD